MNAKTPRTPRNAEERFLSLLSWRFLLGFLGVLAFISLSSSAHAETWLRATTQPIWGHADGIRVGLHPLRGPRGLLRVYAPYLRNEDNHVINFIAVEPIVAGETKRALSELEHSKLDDKQGKRMWARNVGKDVVIEDGIERFVTYVEVEPFDNGAHVYLRIAFRADRNDEFAITTFAHDDSNPLDFCILTATMGNYARLRRLWLDARFANAHQLWPNFTGDGFAPHATFKLADIGVTSDGQPIVTAECDEGQPNNAEYAPGTRPHWKYTGEPARQYWRCETPHPALQVQVNGRYVYWKSNTPIPGGVAFENFEMVAPFKQGQQFTFGVEPVKEK